MMMYGTLTKQKNRRRHITGDKVQPKVSKRQTLKDLMSHMLCLSEFNNSLYISRILHQQILLEIDTVGEHIVTGCLGSLKCQIFMFSFCTLV